MPIRLMLDHSVSLPPRPPSAPDAAGLDLHRLEDLLELGRIVKLIDHYELQSGRVVLYQRGARHVLSDRQASAFVAGALNYTTWSYMTAYPLLKHGRANVSPRDAGRLLQQEHRA